MVDVLKTTNQSGVEKIRNHLHLVHAQYEQTFIELLAEAETERQQE